MPYTLLGLAGLSARRGDAVVAGNLLGAVAAHLERHEEVLDPAEQRELATHIDAGHAAGDAFATAYAAGRRIPLDRLASRLT